MKLSELIRDDVTLPPGAGETEIAGLTADSRAVLPGWLFAALPGANVDGRTFIPSAVEHGAAAILTTGDADLTPAANTPVIQSANPRRALALMAAAFYGKQPETVVTITGTNGKTSIASFTRQVWAHLGLKAASMGTLGIAGPGVDRPGSLTTPDPVSLHADLAAIAMRGITHLALEASSHGMDQYRLDGVTPAAAAFTNLTRDHIDYHETMEAYLAAKLRLFSELLPEGAPAVLNADSDAFAAFHDVCRQRGHQVLTYGQSADQDGLQVRNVVPTLDGLTVSFGYQGADHTVALPLIGTFQAGNGLCALGLVLATGGDFKAALGALTYLEGAPGRMQRVAAHPNGAPVFVDYAHTPDALETVLTAMRPHTNGRLVVVFGCGGDRDPGKRPMMGSVATNADIAIVTDDNPRSEDPAAIRAQVMAACPDGVEIGDRRDAIAAALSLLEPADLLVIAGKGHETGQIIGDTTHPFDDAQVAREAVATLEGPG